MLSLDATFERFNLTRKPPLSLVHRSIISDQALADSLACFIWTSIEFQPYLTFQLRLPTSFRTAMPRFCKYFATRRGRLLLNCRICRCTPFTRGRFSPRSTDRSQLLSTVKRLLDRRQPVHGIGFRFSDSSRYVRVYTFGLESRRVCEFCIDLIEWSDLVDPVDCCFKGKMMN